jgi:S-formylglutathione hydrolase FrmB
MAVWNGQLALVVTVIVTGCATATQNLRSSPVSVQNDTIDAASLGRRVTYNVVLPAGYGSGKQYPILWLLHGHSGGKDDWLRRTNLLEEIKRYPFVVVLPDAENSWYVNSPSDPHAAYESFITIDLYNEVVRKFSVDTLHQAIAGLSMGGYGAVMLGLRHPRRYRFVGGLSAGLSVASSMGESDSVLAKTTGESILKAFGSGGIASRADVDPLRMFRRTPADSLPYMFLAIGTRDAYHSFLPANRAFTDSLRSYGARYQYHELPGSHSWALWSAELDPMLESAWEVLHSEGTH